MPTALLLDDDPNCLSVYRAALLMGGFTAITETCGAQAIERFETLPDIDLLIVDLSLAEDESGAAVAKKIRSLRPDVRVLFVSGWPLEEAIGMGLIAPMEWSDEHTAFLTKPFTFQVLIDAALGLLKDSGT